MQWRRQQGTTTVASDLGGCTSRMQTRDACKLKVPLAPDPHRARPRSGSGRPVCSALQSVRDNYFRMSLVLLATALLWARARGGSACSGVSGSVARRGDERGEESPKASHAPSRRRMSFKALSSEQESSDSVEMVNRARMGSGLRSAVTVSVVIGPTQVRRGMCLCDLVHWILKVALGGGWILKPDSVGMVSRTAVFGPGCVKHMGRYFLLGMLWDLMRLRWRLGHARQ